jgi:hypothetical protein
MLWYMYSSFSYIFICYKYFGGKKLRRFPGLLKGHPYGDLPMARIEPEREWGNAY